MRCAFRVPAEICYRHLTTLRLMGVEISNELSTLNVVKFKFPVLETFTLVRCKWLNVKFVEIYAPKMTSFESETRYDDPGVSDYSIKIIGDSFLRFKSHGGGLPEHIVLSRSTVVSAKLFNTYGSNALHLLEKSGIQIRKLLNEFHSLKELELSGILGKAIIQSKLGLSLPRLYDMERLVISSFGSVEALFQLLHVAPSLKFLVICGSCRNDYDYDEEYIPSCTVLEEVDFKWFAGEVNEMKLVKFFLKNAMQLKRVCLTVRTNPRIPKNEISEELSTYPTASTCLTIVVP